MYMGLATVLTLLVGAAGLLERLPWALALAYGVMGLVSFALYGVDKRRAETQRRRISERTMLVTDLCFGIIGGLTGRATFRHKTRKPTYVARTILISLAHFLGLGTLAFGMFSF